MFPAVLFYTGGHCQIKVTVTEFEYSLSNIWFNVTHIITNFMVSFDAHLVSFLL